MEIDLQVAACRKSRRLSSCSAESLSYEGQRAGQFERLEGHDLLVELTVPEGASNAKHASDSFGGFFAATNSNLLPETNEELDHLLVAAFEKPIELSCEPSASSAASAISATKRSSIAVAISFVR